MSAAGFLLLSCAALAAPPDGPAVGSPRLARGDELVYQGELTEAGERIDNRFRKKYELEVRVFVLDTRPDAADCAVLTLVRPLADPVVAGPAAVATGSDPARKPLPPAVDLELVRVDGRGRVVRLAPPPGPPPVLVGPSTATGPPPQLPLDSVPVTELGMFVPLPARPAGVGSTWAAAEAGRPPVVLKAPRETIWNGGRCVEVVLSQQTDGWDRPSAAVTGWKRTETIVAAPADGYASTVRRRIERREGNSLVGWVEASYELQPPARHAGARYVEVRREVEAGYGFLSEVEALLAKPGRPPPVQFRSRLAKIDQFLADQPATGFRPALESARRRCEAAARGEVPAAPATPAPEKADPPRPGRPAPDFVAPLVHSSGQFRLSAARGAPAVLVFFKPDSVTSAGALAVAEALHRGYAGRLTVAALAVSAGPEAANRQREKLRLTVPVADGSGPRSAYGVGTYPKFFVVDAAGVLVWQFDGYGDETGYLVKEQVEKLVKRE